MGFNISLVYSNSLLPSNLNRKICTYTMSLDNRAENVLKNLVETYIQQGQPVGSRTLSKLPQLGVSSATVRNVMSDLEELGLIIAPHTSAGRIPTSQGYRLFVDSMIKASSLTHTAISELSSRFQQDTDPEALLAHASDVLSDLTQFAGVVVLPNQSVAKFHQLEFMRLSENRILAILVTEDGRVQNRVLPAVSDFSDSELVSAANFFNHRYKGSTLDSIIELANGHIIKASEFFDEDDPSFDYKLNEGVKVSWVDGWEWVLPEDSETVPDITAQRDGS